MERFKKTIEIPFETFNEVNSWEDFQQEMDRLSTTLQSLKEEQGSTYVSPPLFRGHANSNWSLDSTLNRASGRSETPIVEYLSIAKMACREICQSFPSAPIFHDLGDIADFDLILTPENIHKYIPALAYLRHHSFPSPLLDWSQSHDIAAFFAFRDQSDSDFVSIYVLLEYLNWGKIVNSSSPRILSIGNTLDIHPRHENQKSEYTVCLTKAGSIQSFAQHELVLTKNDKAQDVTLKFR